MAAVQDYLLARDRRGAIWDAVLYVPTVIALVSIGLKLWFSPNQAWAYVLFFMACFFFLTGANRIATRLIVLPGAPAAVAVAGDRISLRLRGGATLDLVKNLRYFSDYAGRSFALAGMDVSGKRHQFVFHRGQFTDPAHFQDIQGRLAVYK